MDDAADRLHERLLVLRCQGGDGAAFAELVEKYSPRVAYFLAKLLAGTPGGEDLLQDVWFDAFRGLPKLQDPAAFQAWLYRIARDRAWRLLRKRRPTRQLIEEEIAEPEEADFDAEDAGRVHAALDELEPEHREVLTLRFLEEMSYERIAEVVGCKVGTVRSRIHYAKHALRREMGEMP